MAFAYVALDQLRRNSEAIDRRLALSGDDVAQHLAREDAECEFVPRVSPRPAYAVETVELWQEVPKSGPLAPGACFDVPLGRHGDAVTRVVLCATLAFDGPTVRYPLEQLFSSVELLIGSSVIDTLTPAVFRVYDETMRTEGESAAYRRMASLSASDRRALLEPGRERVLRELHLPLVFWFCAGARHALHADALHFHNISLRLRLADAGVRGVALGDPENRLRVTADYVVMDPKLRRRVSWTPHDVPVTRWHTLTVADAVPKRSSADAPTADAPTAIDLGALPRGPLRFLAWMAHADGDVSTCNEGRTDEERADDAGAPVRAARLRANVFTTCWRSGRELNLVEPAAKFGRAPRQAGVYLHSFAEDPRDWRPSSHLNTKGGDLTLEVLFKEPDDDAGALWQVADTTRHTVCRRNGLRHVTIVAQTHGFLTYDNGMAGFAPDAAAT